MKNIKIPEKKQSSQIEVKKSKFIAIAEPVNSVDIVKQRIASIRKQYLGCSHVVYAYFLKDDRSVSGLSDDGEPHGTAGRPVYEVLKGSGLTDILLTVTRYFGGTKLGTGGLVSAYSLAAKNVLDEISIIEKIYTVRVNLELDYKSFEQVKRLFSEIDVRSWEEEFSSNVRVLAEIPEEKYRFFVKKINNISRGTVIPEIIDKGGN